MKKITTAILFFITVHCFAQTPNFVLDSIKPNVICQNEATKFYAHFTGTWNASSTAAIKDSLSTFQINFTYQNWVDSNYVITYTIYSGILTVGTHKIYMPSINPSPSKNLTVNNCVYGIEHYNNQADLLSTEYFNLLGQPIKEPDGVTIEVKTYRGGQREVRKVVTK